MSPRRNRRGGRPAQSHPACPAARPNRESPVSTWRRGKPSVWQFQSSRPPSAAHPPGLRNPGALPREPVGERLWAKSGPVICPHRPAALRWADSSIGPYRDPDGSCRHRSAGSFLRTGAAHLGMFLRLEFRQWQIAKQQFVRGRRPGLVQRAFVISSQSQAMPGPVKAIARPLRL